MLQPSRFPFLDEGEALRRLNVDRDTLLGLVRDGRLRAYSGFGKGNFFRMRDLDALYTELYGEPSADDSGAEATPGKGKPFDPGYKVHVRLQADLKWYDLSDDDLRAWVREMHEDGYPRQRVNITNTISRLQRLIELMDEAASGWRVLQPAAQTPAASAPSSPTAKPARGRPLPMMGDAPALPTAPSAPDPSTAPPAPNRGRSLQMLGAPATPAPTTPEPTVAPEPPKRGRTLQMFGAPAVPTAPAPSAPSTPAPISARGRPLQMVARPSDPAPTDPAPPVAPPPPAPNPTKRGRPLPIVGSPPSRNQSTPSE